jgi:exodeoxyribonuclease VII small subunit
MATEKTKSYQLLSSELEDVLTELQAEDIDIDAAVTAYEKGMTIIAELEKQLKTAENKVKRIKLKFDAQ